MSGTSVDAVDAAAVCWQGQSISTLGSIECPLPQPLRTRLLALMDGRAVTLETLYTLDADVATLHAQAVDVLIDTHHIDRSSIDAIGFHGQTVYHAPNANPAYTVQLGDPNRLAIETGLPVVADVRRADMALGGQGAPLAPGLHIELFQRSTESRAVLNLGGIANLTVLPCDDRPVQGFDTGPANALTDAWCERYLNVSRDTHGACAATGTVNADILAALRTEPYFAQPPPKSTGRDLFTLEWLENRADRVGVSNQDMLATLVELTATTVAEALSRVQPDCARVLVAGGGRHNRTLMARLAAHIPHPVETTDAHGVDGDSLEAVLMAWLARQRVLQAPANVPTVTGATSITPLGGLYLPHRAKPGVSPPGGH